MKLRTVEELYDFISGELAWRRHELQALRSLITTSQQSPARHNALLRSMIGLTYAHWEGYVKACATAYIQFVAMQRLNHAELSFNFVALAIRPLLFNVSQSKRVEDHIKIVEFFINQFGSRSSISYKDSIYTESNLSSRVFRDIVLSIGVDYSPYATKEKLIDEKLLKMRNMIAHGEFLTVSVEDTIELQHQVIEMMELLMNQIDNAASLRIYSISPIS